MVTLKAVTAWIFSFMVSAAPPGRKVYYPEGQETKEDALVRYDAVARDIVDVVYSPNVKPLFTGPNGRAQTVSVILSVMSHESAFMRHVDLGLGKYARGDQGRSWCSMQINIGAGKTMKWNVKHDRPVEWNDDPADVFDGYTGEELIANRKLCISEGLKILRISFGSTKGLPLDERLRVYASGDRNKGAEASRNRMRTAMMFFQKTAKTREFTDNDVMLALAQYRTPVFNPVPAIDIL
jgi:hypothetical protein